MGTRREDRRAASAPRSRGEDAAMPAGCALCGGADRPAALSLTTTAPTRPVRLRVVPACRDCAARAANYAALIAALLHAAVPEASAPPPAA